MRPPYSFRDPAWKMRLTAGHSCLLVDGMGHQYVDGQEGTNSSQASASLTRWGERKGYFFWTSDATPAYALVLPDVRSVTRTIVALTETPAVVVIDKVMKKSVPSKVQARFYTFNSDGKGDIAAADSSFTATRPHARLVASASSNAGVGFTASLPDIPAAQAKLYPYGEVGTTLPEMEICLVTVLLPLASGGGGGTARVDREKSMYTAHIASGTHSITVRIFDTGAVPEFEVDYEP
jgi:hypothetical protein